MKTNLIIAITLISMICGCKPQDQTSSMTSPDSNDTFTIIAGSELKDMDEVLKNAQTELKFPIKVTYTGTIDGVEQFKQGLQVDAAWFSQGKYFYDDNNSAKRIKLGEKIMLSPVVVGVRQKSFDKLAIKNINSVTWSNIYDWVTKNNLTYAMTDPSASNTGYVALMGVAYSLAGTGENLKTSDVNPSKMKEFFKGHKINAGSSAWLMEAFTPSTVDFVVNYESVILQYNKTHPQDRLQLVYPNEGIVTSDYPILLANEKKIEQYKQLVSYLKRSEIQQAIMNTTARRPINNQVALNDNLFNKDQFLVEMPFTPDTQVSEQLLSAYFTEYKKPAAVVFVLDTSGSMSRDGREEQLKQAISALTVQNNETTKYAKLRDREKVWIVPFSSQTYGIKKFEMTGQLSQVNAQINDYVQHLRMDGGTALFTATAQAVQLLKDEMVKNPDYRFSVIVLTDGQVNEGISISEFNQFMQTSKIKQGDVRIYPVLFGEASGQELQVLASSSGGKVFDGNKRGLTAAFKEIRSYQ